MLVMVYLQQQLWCRVDRHFTSAIRNRQANSQSRPSFVLMAKCGFQEINCRLEVGSIDWLHNNDKYASSTIYVLWGLGMLNSVISTVKKGRVLVRVHMETFWVFKFRIVVLHVGEARIRIKFQKYSKEDKRSNKIFAEKPLMKTATFSQISRKKQVPMSALMRLPKYFCMRSWFLRFPAVGKTKQKTWISNENCRCPLF